MKTVTITKEGAFHLDHGVNDRTLKWITGLEVPAGQVHVQTLELPAHCADLENGLYGPAAGDSAVKEKHVFYERRGERAGLSRTIDERKRPSRLITIITGPANGVEGVIYTCYGGPAAEREPFEFANDDTSDEAVKSREFWSKHALASEE